MTEIGIVCGVYIRVRHTSRNELANAKNSWNHLKSIIIYHLGLKSMKRQIKIKTLTDTDTNTLHSIQREYCAYEKKHEMYS